MTFKPTHGQSRSPTYVSWYSMWSRVRAPSAAKGYAFGISVDARWSSFETFLADMGERPGKEFTLDRIDNTKGYEPSNCRWASKATQSRNRSFCKLTERDAAEIRRRLEGAPRGTQTRLAREYGVSEALVSLIKNGGKWR